MHIFIKCPNGRTLTFEVLKETHVREVKMKITEKETYEVETMVLRFNGPELDDGRTLEYYGIVEESTLTLTIVPLGAVGGDHLEFFVIVPANNAQRTVTIRDLTKDSTGLNLKETVSDLEGCPVASQNLVFGGKPLRDDQTLGDQGLYYSCSVFLTFRVPGGDSL